MKAQPIVLVLAVALVGSDAGLVRAQAPTREQISRAEELARPGPEHALLAGLAGAWRQEIRVWPEPGAPPVTLSGSAENRSILGGRFLESWSKADYMGQATESLSILGFDRRHGVYTVVGMDTFGTYAVLAAGGAGADPAVLVLSGTDEDPVLGHTQEYDIVVRVEGPDRYVTEVIFHDEAHTRGMGPFKAVEIAHTRRSR